MRIVRRTAAAIKRAYRRCFPEPLYVIIYDKLDDTGFNPTEEYYGYFSSPAEARELWGTFSESDPDGYENVMLCRVEQRWMQPNEGRD